ncbi:MAG: 6-carboxytetrahydropterin synthase [Pseudomonadota bacterium]
MYEQSYQFSFEAAHELGANIKMSDSPDGEAHPYSRIHGHSFVATVTLGAANLSDGKWIVDYAELKRDCQNVASRLDHRLLNEIEGLSTPTLECLARWIFDAVRQSQPALTTVEVARPTLGEKVRYSAGE